MEMPVQRQEGGRQGPNLKTQISAHSQALPGDMFSGHLEM